MVIQKLLLVTLFLLSNNFSAAAQAVSDPLPVDIPHLLDSVKQILKDTHQSSLMQAIVSRDTVLFSGAFGEVDIDAGLKANSLTLFPMASITKTFTAFAIMKLVRDGKLSLNDELSKIAPKITFTNPWEKTNPLRIIHLLEHTSGFDDLRLNTFWNDDLNIAELQAVKKCKNSMRCRWKPGERQAYSNVGYIILGYLVEKISGLKYENFLKEEILLPLGMTNSNFIIPTKPDKAYATPYEWDGTNYELLPFLQMVGKGSGALYSCADDMARFVEFMLNNGDNTNLPDLHSIVEQMEIPESTPAA